VNPATIFRIVYGSSKNFMTPDIIEYGNLTPYAAYELSSGEGIFNDKVWGVTIAAVRPLEHELLPRKFNHMSQGGFLTIREARAYLGRIVLLLKAVSS
jgi:hypothetical protein